MSENTTETAPDAGLLKKVVTGVLLLFVAVSVVFVIVREVRGGGEGGEQVDARVMVYYFHGNYRCATCNTIERLTHETVQERFADELASGTVQVRSVNVDEPANRHFTDIYELDLEMPRTVIVAEFDESGRRVGWEPLLGVWDLFNKPAQFKDYVAGEIESRLPDRDAAADRTGEGG
jgi:hypothetical protein